MVQKSRLEILNQVFRNELQPEEGFRLYKQELMGVEEGENEVGESMDIAVIGITGRFPDADDTTQLWEMLSNGKSPIKEAERWDMTSIFSQSKGITGKTYAKWGGFLSNIYEFDPLFFEMSPRQAEFMEPRQRLFLEEAWHVIEDAGYSASSMKGKKCGVFIGSEGGTHYFDKMKPEQLSSQAFLGSSNSVLASRISYFLDLQGPSVTIDTACSSSLSALHLACESIKREECEMAIAGGVHLIDSKESYILLSSMGMLSETGKCKAFSEDADGFVPGEAVAAVLLKPYERAKEDGDYIYGIIKGSSMNQDGKTNGITAPNKSSQVRLMKQVYQQNHIEPKSISYVEAHGTGTKLGDPIEFHALKEVFETSSMKKQFCGLGSLKSNIGHSAAASGISSLIKVMLCMKHKELVPTLHVEDVNREIDLAESPFYLVTESKEWKSDGMPRRAAISSFGHSGTNCHIIVEEAEEPVKPIQEKEGTQYLFPISAKTKDALKTQQEQLLVWLRNNSNVMIRDISYTLCMGRTHFKIRSIFRASNKEMLIKQLEDTLKNQDSKKLYGEGISNNNEIIRAEEKYLEQGEIEESIFDGICCYRIPLPTYPFAKKEYRLPEEVLQEEQKKEIDSLIDQVSSIKGGFCCKKLFTGDEFFIKDHSSILPAVVYIEMARQAGTLVLGGRIQVSEMKDLVWMKPLIIKERQEILTKIYPCEEGVQFTIGRIEEGIEQIYAQGSFVYANVDVNLNVYNTSPKEKHIFWQEDDQMQGGYDEAIAYYTMMSKENSFLGKRFQGMKAFYWNGNKAKCIVELPKELMEFHSMYGIHPVLMDGGIQSAVCFAYHLGANQTIAYLPFTMEKLTIHRALSFIKYAYVEIQEDTQKKSVHFEAERTKFQITYTDAFGNVVLEVKNFTVRGLQSKEENLFYFKETYREKSLSHADVQKLEQLEQYIFEFPVQNEWTCQNIDAWIEQGMIQLVNQLKFYEKQDKKPEKLLIVYPVRQEENQSSSCYLDGFILSLQQENYPITMRSIGVDKTFYEKSKNEQELLLWAELMDWKKDDYSVLYQEGKRFVKELVEVEPIYPNDNFLPVKQGGVYLITGGAGGLGMFFAHCLSKEANVKLILMGRSSVSSSVQKEFSSMQESGTEVTYIQGDVTRKEDVESIIQMIKERYHALDGIFHCAGVVHDKLFMSKTIEQIKQVVAPKINGTVVLWECVKEESLDFFTLFSSTTAILGNAGQCDYAFANQFMDTYAKKMQSERGDIHILSINWPLWEEGGMQVPKETKKLLEHLYGIMPLTREQGYSIWKAALKSELTNIAVVVGEKDKLRKKLTKGQKDALRIQQLPVRDADVIVSKEMSYQVFSHRFLEIIAEIMKLEIEEIDLHTKMSEYGFDSILFTELANKVNEAFGLHVSPAVFFGHSTSMSIAQELYEEHKDELCFKEVANVSVPAYQEKSEQKEEKKKSEDSFHDVAIIGISGKMPDAQNLDEFWENLIQKKNSVKEIPKERWNYMDYYGDPQTETGKTNIKWGAFIDEVDKFDPLFFHILPSDVDTMDPQARQIVEHTWSALEDAGYKPSSLSGTHTSVFMGVTNSDYKDLMLQDGIFTAITNGFVASEVSYLLDLKGVSESVDTACSSSLVAIHKAVQEIRSGRCEMAIAGGVNLMLSPNVYIVESKSGMLAADGTCKSFDEKADGYVRGEGVAVLVLKSLATAKRDRDFIYGVIKGTAVSNNGHGNSITVPSSNAQADALIKACTDAQVNPNTITYIEAHGTGTKLGDPVEIEGIRKAYRTLYEQWGEEFIEAERTFIGTVKTNIGHLESAAGVAGVVKVLKAMEYKKLPALLHFEKQNPYIDLTDTPFAFVTDTKEWEVLRDTNGQKIPRRAGISSFGISGVNAHIILEEYENVREKNDTEKKTQLILLSGRNEETLQEMVEQFYDYLDRKSPQYSLTDIAYTLQTGREEQDTRLAVIASSISELKKELERYMQEGRDNDTIYMGRIVDQTEQQIVLKGERLMKKSLPELALLWIQGAQIEWNDLYRDCKAYKVPLPGYIFEKRRCWYKEVQDNSDEKRKEENHNLMNEVESKLYYIVAEVLKLKEGDIDRKKELTYYGLDSISTMQLSNRIQSTYGVELSELSINQDSFSFEELAMALAHLKGHIEKEACCNNQKTVIFRNVAEVRMKLPLDQAPIVNEEEVRQAKTFILKLISNNIALWMEQEQLVICGMEDKLNDELIGEASSQFYAIRAYMRNIKYHPQSMAQLPYYDIYEQSMNSEENEEPRNDLLINQILLKGNLNQRAFGKAIESLLARHDILRALYTKEEGVYIEKIMPVSWKSQYEYVDMRQNQDVELRNKVMEEKQHEMERMLYALEEEPNAYFYMVRISEIEYIFYVSVNHILFDEFSFRPLFEDLIYLYQQYDTGIDEVEEQRPPQYLLYTLHEDVEQERIDGEFWNTYLSDVDLFLKFPLDYKRPEENLMQGDVEYIFFGNDIMQDWVMWLRERNLSLFDGMLSVMSILISRWVKEERFLLTYVMQRRDCLQYEQMLGDFNNMLPIKFEIIEDLSYEEIVLTTKQELKMIQQHQSYPLEKIIELVADRFTRENPFFNINVNQPTGYDAVTFADGLEGFLIQPEEEYANISILDVRFEWIKQKNGLEFRCLYNTSLFKKSTIKMLLENLQFLMKQVSKNPYLSLRDIFSEKREWK